MNVSLKAFLVAGGMVFATQAAAQLTLYADDGFHGNRVTADHRIDDFANSGFNDRASSAQVRGGAWEVCTDAHFGGRCVVLRPGSYPSLGAMGLNDKISSIRPVDRYGRSEEPNYDQRRYGDRPHDQYYSAPRERDYSGAFDQYYSVPRYRDQ